GGAVGPIGPFADHGNGAVAVGLDDADLALAVLVPVVGDDAVLVGRGAGRNGSVTGGGEGEGVVVVAVLVPGTVTQQPAEAVLVVQLLPFLRVVAAHLVEDEQHDQLGPVGLFLALLCQGVRITQRGDD